MFMDPELAAFMADRQAKQVYLTDEIASKGYDQVMFAQYITQKKGTAISTLIFQIENGTDIDVWTFDELTNVV